MLELTLNQLAEVTTTTLSKKQKPQTFDENVNVARQGGGIAGDTRKAIEKASGEPVITSKKAVDFARLLADVIEDKNKE
jgi:hypothetical protein